MAKKLLVALMALMMATVLLVACGGGDTTTAETTTTEQPTINTTEKGTTTTKPEETTTPKEEEPVTPETTRELTELEQLEYDSIWLGDIHMGISVDKRKDKANPSVEYPYVFHFGYKSEGGHFLNDPETDVPGIQFTEPVCMYIKNVEKDADFIKYDIDYYETADWWQIWASAKDFVPEDGASYLIYLFIKTGEHARDPYTNHFFVTWESDPWVYEAPELPVSGVGDINAMIPDINDRTQLFKHDAFTVDTNGNVRFTFKSDNQPFTNGTDTPGLAFTLMNKVFVNGEEKQIVTESYVTEQWYIINFQIADFNIAEGETCEIVFSINSNDTTGDYCNNPNGYFAIEKECVVTAPAV